MELRAWWAVLKASLQYTSASFLPFGRSSKMFEGSLCVISVSGFVSMLVQRRLIFFSKPTHMKILPAPCVPNMTKDVKWRCDITLHVTTCLCCLKDARKAATLPFSALILLPDLLSNPHATWPPLQVLYEVSTYSQLSEATSAFSILALAFFFHLDRRNKRCLSLHEANESNKCQIRVPPHSDPSSKMNTNEDLLYLLD